MGLVGLAPRSTSHCPAPPQNSDAELRIERCRGTGGDLVCCSHNSQIATLTARQTRYVMLPKVPDQDAKSVVNLMIKHAQDMPQEL